MRGTPSKYAVVADTIGREIREGLHAEGTLLPTEAELSARFNVSRHTVRHGLRALRERGLVTSRQGRGTEVVAGARRTPARASHRVSPFLGDPLAWTLRDVKIATVDAADHPQVQLGPPAPRRLLRVTGRLQGGAPGDGAAETEIFLDAAHGDLADRIRDGVALAPLLAERHGLHPHEIRQEVRAEPVVAAAPDTCRLALVRRYVDGTGTPYMVLRATCPPAAFALQTDIAVGF